MYYLTGLLGLVSIVAPYLFSYSDNTPALWTSLTFGAVLVVASILESFAKDRQSWENWVVGVAGVGAILAPFVLGFNFITAAVWTMMIVGAVTTVAAGARLFQGEPKTGLV